ncbi:MAG: L-histidine N(alpha)-methyltransferase [Candidatus Melainabacteria bacterium]|nr:L-histidine N(alpha)-methyltransferase [Candidatus Melainabacteria bacterium]MBI3308547.1 L-histidine N(alpha)-methyltransferase [Candidatus Melainabacteria bacterium]
MTVAYKVLDQKDLGTSLETKEVFALDVLHGLSQTPKTISSKYFYDDKGSKYFQRITELEEYYLTRCEYEILNTYKNVISDYMNTCEFNLIELGAGDGKKTNILIEHFLQNNLRFNYVPIDISEAAMSWLTNSLKQKFPKLSMYGLVSEYFNAIKWLGKSSNKRNLVLFLGSNIGNFSKGNSKVFLRSLWNSLNDGDYVLIGFDLKKDINLLLNAYNDSEGITKEFNINLLKRINQELKGNFDISKFQFFANYNVSSGAIESYLLSTEKQQVLIEHIGQVFSFKAWEPIHTEYSYKYLQLDIESLANETGFLIENQFYDSKKYFTDSIWKVCKHA